MKSSYKILGATFLFSFLTLLFIQSQTFLEIRKLSGRPEPLPVFSQNFKMAATAFDPDTDTVNVLVIATTTNATSTCASYGRTINSNCFTTIAAAVSSATTTPGSTIGIMAGTYSGSVTINKSITLWGEGKTSTILDGVTKTGTGITIVGGTNDVFIYDMGVTRYSTGVLRNSGAASNSNIVFEDFESSNNNDTGIAMYGNGPLSDVTFNKVTASNNNTTGTKRGIYIWASSTKNILVENGTFLDNGIAGVEIYASTNFVVDGVKIIGNTVRGGDAGIVIDRIQSYVPGEYPNEVSSNDITISGTGRFGIEVKSSKGNGTESGAGSVVVKNNNIHFTSGHATRDLAGIAVYDSYYFNRGSSDIIIKGNTVDGIVQSNAGSEGFGIVVSGQNHKVLENTITNCEVGFQEQQGFNYPTSNQDTQNDTYFGRDSATVVTSGVTVQSNNFSGNTVNARNVGIPTSVDITLNWFGTTTLIGVQSLVAGTTTHNPYYMDEAMTILSNIKSITGFTIPNQTGTSVINQGEGTIKLTMPARTNVTALVPTVSFDGSSVSPISGTSTNFTSPVTYTVTSYDEDSTKDYLVTVTVPHSGQSTISNSISYVAGPGGTISGNTVQDIAQGQTGTAVIATPDVGHTFINWSDQVTTPSRTDSSPDSSITITAYFSPEPGQEIGGDIETPATTTATSTVTKPPVTPPGKPKNPPTLGNDNVVCGLFLRNLSINNNKEGADVKCLQIFLNTHGYILGPDGPGSPGQESTIFAGRTKNALAKFQLDNSIFPALGNFGDLTRAFVNTMLP